MRDVAMPPFTLKEGALRVSIATISCSSVVAERVFLEVEEDGLEKA
jgi:hypothetical protein